MLTVIEKVLILEPARVIQTIEARKVEIVHVKVDGRVSALCDSQGQRWLKRGICYCLT